MARQSLKDKYEDEHRRAEQLALNCKWLIGKTDEIFFALCPDQMGTWQQRAEMASLKAKELGPSKQSMPRCPACGSADTYGALNCRSCGKSYTREIPEKKHDPK